MTATAALNLIVSIVVVAGLAAVARLGYLAAGERLYERSAPEGSSLVRETERRAA